MSHASRGVSLRRQVPAVRQLTSRHEKDGAETKTFVQQRDNFELVYLLIEPFSLTQGHPLGLPQSLHCKPA
jgi:hypothetical protein